MVYKYLIESPDLFPIVMSHQEITLDISYEPSSIAAGYD